jgi:hypothetical protein
MGPPSFAVVFATEARQQPGGAARLAHFPQGDFLFALHEYNTSGTSFLMENR